MKRNKHPETCSRSSNGLDEIEKQEAKRRRQTDKPMPSLRTSIRVDSRYGTEPARGSDNRMGSIQETCLMFHDEMRQITEECRRRATEEDLSTASKIEQVMAMLNSLTDGTNEVCEASKQHAVCATCMMKKSSQWMCDLGPVIWEGAENPMCCACRAGAVIKLAFSFAACVKKRLEWGLKEQYNMRVLGMLQVVAYEHYTDAVRNQEYTQQAVKRKWEKLMIENRKLGEAEDEVKIFRETHSRIAVLATTTELATRAVPNQKMFLAKQEAFDHDETPEQTTYNVWVHAHIRARGTA